MIELTFKQIIENPRTLDGLSRKQAIKFIKDYVSVHSEKAMLRIMELEEELERRETGIILRGRK